jgi:hypothetical protein
VGVAKSGRRRIVVEGEAYLWAVYRDAEFFGANIVMVISPDKKFYVRYALSQSASVRHLEKVDGSTRRYRCPQFGSSETFSPRNVRALIEWCKNDLAAAVEVDWRGEEFSGKSNPPTAATR